jgi:hypothetical protein
VIRNKNWSSSRTNVFLGNKALEGFLESVDFKEFVDFKALEV